MQRGLFDAHIDPEDEDFTRLGSQRRSRRLLLLLLLLLLLSATTAAADDWRLLAALWCYNIGM